MPYPERESNWREDPISDKQVNFILKLVRETRYELKAMPEHKGEASQLIDHLLNLMEKQKIDDRSKDDEIPATPLPQPKSKPVDDFTLNFEEDEDLIPKEQIDIPF